MTWAQIVEESSKILTFIDVAGNEKYAKTMIRGICSHYPDYVLIVVDATQGMTQIGKDHFQLAMAFNVPIIIVVTKSEQVSLDEQINVKDSISDLLKPSERLLIPIVTEEAMVLCSRRITDEQIVPVFEVSSVSGAGLELFLNFLYLLPININSHQWKMS